MLFCLEVYGIAAGALNTAQGCAIEAQECFAAARAAQFAFNHDALSFLLVAVCPVLSNLAFGVELHPKTQYLLCLSHGGLRRGDNKFCDFLGATRNLYFIHSVFSYCYECRTISLQTVAVCIRRFGLRGNYSPRPTPFG